MPDPGFQKAIDMLKGGNDAINRTIEGIKVEVAKQGEKLEKQTQEIAFLRNWIEINSYGLRKIQEIQMLQDNQERKLKSLEKQVDEDILPKLEELERQADSKEQQQLVINFRKRIKNNLTRAKGKVG